MSNYKDLALEDLKAAKALFHFDMWNKVGRECQQVCEKYIKHFLSSRHLLSNELERTHNLRKLFMAVPERDKDLSKDLVIVSNYYFETNYPGDNFIRLDKEMAEEAIKTAKALIKYLDDFDVDKTAAQHNKLSSDPYSE